jgi:hypothetical protein
MKKFSTVGLVLTFAFGLAPLSTLAADAHAQTLAAAHCEFLADAPDQHSVVRGDTLWEISGKFLRNPWCWPQVWGLNRAQIRDPHWIYPGQIVYLDRAAGRLRLGTTLVQGSPNGRLTPQIRAQNLPKEAIPAIPAGAIEPFLSQPLIVEETQLQTAPRIVAGREERVYFAKDDKAYVRGDLQGATLFQAFRPATPLRDPATNEIIGYEAIYLGTLKLDRAATAENEAHRFIVTNSKEEMGIGDRLVPMPPAPLLNYVPHPPAAPVDARVVSIYGGVRMAGQNQIVSINRGKKDGLDIGTVLTLYRYNGIIADRTDNKKQVKLPDYEYGNMFIFRVSENISYGLIMQVTDVVKVGDVAKAPE